MEQLSQNTIQVNKNDILCKSGDASEDLFYVSSGRLLICARAGRMITPLAYLSKGDYFGELSFFDKLPRSADVLAVEDSTLIKIPHTELHKQFPKWLHLLAKQMSAKLRLMDKVISERGIKKRSVDSIKPLTIEEQRFYFNLIENSESK